jgi:hypothetical protein
MKKIKLSDIAAPAIEKNKKKILDAQREQLSEGKRGDGKNITPIYSDAYAKKKGFKTPDLKLSGDMYKQMDIIVGVPNDSEYTIFSDVEYFPKLNERYDKAFELNKPSKKVPEVNNDILEAYHKAINK